MYFLDFTQGDFDVKGYFVSMDGIDYEFTYQFAITFFNIKNNDFQKGNVAKFSIISLFRFFTVGKSDRFRITYINTSTKLCKIKFPDITLTL